MRDGYGPQPNPFLRPLPPPGRMHSMHVREWEFEARDENHVRELLKEAQESNIGSVQGYSLRSIECIGDDIDP
jgi:hypothetical protein